MSYVPSSKDRLKAEITDSLCKIILLLPIIWPAYLEYAQEGSVHMGWAALAYVLLVTLLYDFLSYWLWQATPGKWVYGLRLVSQRDPQSELKLDAIAMRILVSQFSILLSWAIFVVALFRYDRRHLPDFIAGTRVISSKPRADIAKPRWIIGGLFLVYFMATGMAEFNQIYDAISLDRDGVQLEFVLGSGVDESWQDYFQ